MVACTLVAGFNVACAGKHADRHLDGDCVDVVTRDVIRAVLTLSLASAAALRTPPPAAVRKFNESRQRLNQ